MPTLEAILNATIATLPTLRARRPELERAAIDRPPPPAFFPALRGASVALIAEVKRRSPSVGAINESLDPVTLATAYSAGGASAISVLTDREFFGGSMADLEAVVAAVPTPVLRKDFILDGVQLLEARAAGASAALLIVRALDHGELVRLIEFALNLDMTPLVEAHTRGGDRPRAGCRRDGYRRERARPRYVRDRHGGIAAAARDDSRRPDRRGRERDEVGR